MKERMNTHLNGQQPEMQPMLNEKTTDDTFATGNTSSKKTPIMIAPECYVTDVSNPNNSLYEFTSKIIECYKPFFVSQNVFDVFMQLIEILNKHGDNPSIVLDKKDLEARSLRTFKEMLSKTNLRSHSCLVARIIANELQSRPYHEIMVPKFIITALAHDLGKIPEFRQTARNDTHDHALVSANKLNELFYGKTVFWAKDVVKAIDAHHSYMLFDELSQILHYADKQARQNELLQHSKECDVKSFEEWFQANEFLRYIEPSINMKQSGQIWQALTFDGVLYCRPYHIYDTVQKMCKTNNVLYLSMGYESEKEKVLKMIIKSLADENCIHEKLMPGFLAMRFSIEPKRGKTQKHALTPIRTDRFIDKYNEIERRKIGFVENIKSIKTIGHWNYS